MALNYNDLINNPGIKFDKPKVPLTPVPRINIDNSKGLNLTTPVVPKPIAPVVPKPIAPVIPVDKLTTQGEIPYVEPKNTTTAKSNLNNSLSGVSAAPVAIPPAPVKSPSNPALDEYKRLTGQLDNKGADTLAAQEEVQLVAKREALQRSDEALLRLGQRYEDEVKDIKKNSEGVFGGALQSRFNDAEGRYLDKKADIAIDRLANQGDIDTALKIVEDKINAKYEPIQNQIDHFNQLVSLIQHDVTDSEKIRLEEISREKQDDKNFNQQKELISYTASTKAKYEAANPIQIDPATGQQILKQLSYTDNAKLNATPQAKTIKDGVAYKQAVENYKTAIEKHGTGEWFGAGSGELNSSYQTLVGAIKDYYQLGTLDNGVEKLIELGIKKPSVAGQKSARIGALDTQIAGVNQALRYNADQLNSTGFAGSIELQQLIDAALGVKPTATGATTNDPAGVMQTSNVNVGANRLNLPF